MNRDPASFVPVKYGPAVSDGGSPAVNLMVGGSFVLLLGLLFRNMHGKKGGPMGGKKSGSGRSGGGFGGMNDIMNVSKSNA